MGLALLAIIGVIAVITVIAWLLGVDPLAPGNWSGQANEVIGPWRTVLMSVRWTLWVLLWWRWEQVGERLFRGDTQVGAAQMQQWAGMRRRLMGGIAVVEVIILLSAIAGG
jgi:hypothetical protein